MENINYGNLTVGEYFGVKDSYTFLRSAGIPFRKATKAYRIREIERLNKSHNDRYKNNDKV